MWLPAKTLEESKPSMHVHVEEEGKVKTGIDDKIS